MGGLGCDIEVFGAGLYRRGKVKVWRRDSDIICQGSHDAANGLGMNALVLRLDGICLLSATTGEHSSGGLEGFPSKLLIAKTTSTTWSCSSMRKTTVS